MLHRIWSWMKKVAVDFHFIQFLTYKWQSFSETALEKGPSTVSTNVNFPSFLLREKSLLTRKPLAPLGECSSGSVCWDWHKDYCLRSCSLCCGHLGQGLKPLSLFDIWETTTTLQKGNRHHLIALKPAALRVKVSVTSLWLFNKHGHLTNRFVISVGLNRHIEVTCIQNETFKKLWFYTRNGKIKTDPS